MEFIMNRIKSGRLLMGAAGVAVPVCFLLTYYWRELSGSNESTFIMGAAAYFAIFILLAVGSFIAELLIIKGKKNISIEGILFLFMLIASVACLIINHRDSIGVIILGAEISILAGILYGIITVIHMFSSNKAIVPRIVSVIGLALGLISVPGFLNLDSVWEKIVALAAFACLSTAWFVSAAKEPKKQSI